MAPASKGRRSKQRRLWWQELDQRELRDVRLCDLELRLEHTAMQARIDQLHEELERAGMRFRPHVWLSTDWFTPDDSTGFAVPFYLAHPRLTKLEHRQMFQAEGASHSWCMKLLRHEAGHALDNAYGLRRRKRFREVFGRASEPYRESYAVRPASREHVQNLDFWYAQSHPLEDWAETFAIWMRPGARWRSRYRGWPAMRKLEYVDELMAEIADRPAPFRSRKTPDSLPRLRLTLREYYEEKQSSYATEPTQAYDRSLRRLFSDAPGFRRRKKAAQFLRENRRGLRNHVADLSGQYRYVVDQVLKTLIVRSRELELRVNRAEPELRVDAAIVLATLTTRMVRGGRPRFFR